MNSRISFQHIPMVLKHFENLDVDARAWEHGLRPENIFLLHVSL